VRGQVGPEQLEALKSGVDLEDGPARFSDIVDSGGSGENHWYHVTIMEGRNREVRRLWDSQGVTVSRLKRVRYGAAFLPHRLRMGEFHEISASDHQVLREDVGLGEAEAELVLVEEGVGAKRPAPGKNKTRPRKGRRGKGPGPANQRGQKDGARKSAGTRRGPSGRKTGPGAGNARGPRKRGPGSK
jgi:23S rRNA pseudouridine2605 synthase